MKIAFFLSDLSGGGAERILLNVASWLKKENLDITLLCVDKSGPLLPDIPENLPVHDFGSSGVLAAVPSLGRYLKQHGVDVLLTTQLHNNVAASLARRYFAPGCKLILREANHPSRHNVHGNGKRRLHAFMAKRLYRSADRFIAVSGGVKKDMTEWYGLRAESIRVIPNPVVDDRIAELAEQEPAVDRESQAGAWLRDPATRVVVTAGRVTWQKGHDILLEALALARIVSPDLKLIILGSYREEDTWYRSLQELATELRLEDHVHFAGYQTNPFAFMARADLFALSSRWEGLPAVLIQALACGTRVVAADCPSGPSEILEGGKWGELVPPGSPEQLAIAIQRALETPANSDDLRRRADHWRIEKRAGEYLDLIRDVAGGES